MERNFSYQNGFTLVEMLVAISIFSVLIFVTIAMVQIVLFGSSQQFLALNNVDNAREVTTRFANEIRSANNGVDGSYAVNSPGDNQIIFYSQSSNNGATVNRIRYYLSGTTLYKGITVPTGNVYNLANEAISTVQTNVQNQAGNPVFLYYDGNYDGTTSALVQPINVTNIKFIRMNLAVLNDVKIQGTATFTISAGAAIRNLKTNLGN